MPLRRKASSLLGLATLAALGLAASPTHAQIVNFQGSTQGSINGAPLGNTSTFQNLTFNFGSFNTSTSSLGFVGLSSGQLGTMTLAGTGPTVSFTNVPFILQTTFTVPAGTTPGSTQFTSTINGSITGTTTGGVSVIFAAPTTKSFTYPGGSFTYGVNSFAVNNGAPPQAISGQIQVTAASTVPEPSSVAAFAFTALGAAGLILKARKRRLSM